MDPTATLIELLRACEQEDHVKAEECIEYLRNWVCKGGHLPKVVDLSASSYREGILVVVKIEKEF
jgi:hypothetical protein